MVEENKMKRKRYLSAEHATADDFGDAFTGLEGEAIYDARTAYGGTWAMMTEASWKIHGHPSRALGLGKGQRYVRNAQGQLELDDGL